MRRGVLALYDGGTELHSDETLIHKLAEMPLNYLGYVVHYQDVRDKLPDIKELDRYAAVLTWFEVPIAKPKPYLEWAAQAIASGTRFVVLGEAGGNPYSSDIRLINNLLSHLGVRHVGQFVDSTFGSRVVRKDNTYLEFERPIDAVLPPFPILKPAGDTHVVLEIEPADRTLYQRSILAGVGPRGGFAASGYIYYYDTGAHRLKWILNPFAFFRAALGAEIRPIPDVTTLSGRRIYFSHVDGNGWNNAVQIPGYREKGAVAAEVFEKEIVAKFPELPLTISVIGGDLDRRYGGLPVSSEIAKTIFSFPHVEIGVHTYTQPLVWDAFDVEAGAGSRAKNRSSDRRGLIAWLTDLDSPTAGRASPTSLSNRAFPQGAFDLDTEVTKAIALAEELAPAGKRAAVYTWSGDNKPFAQAIRATRAASIRNINGGYSRLNASFPSIAYVSPISRSVGEERQIYAGANNENYSLDEMGQPNYAFSNFTETSRNTGAPRRLKPVNLYYSVHSAERSATLNAVQSHLRALSAEPLIPVRTSEYAAIADGFFDVEISAVGPQRWKISRRGALQTLRFDDADLLELDPENSHGAIAQTRFESSLFVGLDAAVEEPVVSLRPKDAASTDAVPTLVDSRWAVRSVLIKPCELRFTAEGFGNGDFLWTGFAPGHYRVSLKHDAGMAWQSELEVAADRRLRFSTPVSGIEPVTVSVQCNSVENEGG